MKDAISSAYTKDSVTSKDGTTIGYRQRGHGPGLILLHGGMKSSQDFTKLGEALSDTFTVYLPDRRGRGLSGPYGDDFSVMREVEDLQALIAKTGTRNIFALSSGALVTLRTALTTPAILKVALYEPPLSTNGSAPTSWVERYDREIGQGKLAAAAITAMKGIGTEPVFSKLPRFVLVPLMALLMRIQNEDKSDNVTIRALIPTQHFDMLIVQNMSDTLQDYSSLQTQVLLMGGTKGPSFLRFALDGLSSTLPYVQRKTFPGLGHDGPENDGRPDLVAEELRDFFKEAHSMSER
jgi:pimeloyl-ACP methyl ester carboxylesterase